MNYVSKVASLFPLLMCVFEREIETSSNPRGSVMASGQVPGW